MSTIKEALLLLSGMALLSSIEGCTTVSSETYSNLQDSKLDSGVIYYLPKQYMRIRATRRPAEQLTTATAAAALARARAVLDTATMERTTARTNLINARNDLAAANAVGNAAIITARTTARDNADLAARQANTSFQAASQQYNMRLDQYNALLSGGTLTPSITIVLEMLPLQPDPKAIYVAQTRPSILRNDETTIQVNERGLLTSANTIADDQTGEIIVQIARTVAAFTTGLGTPVGRSSREGLLVADTQKISCKSETIDFDRIFDPVDAQQVGDINRLILQPCFNRRLQIQGVAVNAPGSIISDAAVTHDKSFAPNNKYEGYAYRSPLPYQISIIALPEKRAAQENSDTDESVTAESADIPEQSVFAMLPNEGPVGYIPMKSSAFVRSEDDVTFANGVVTSWESTKPSTALAVVSLPIRVLEAIFQAPTELIQLRLNLDNANGNLIESQAALIQAQIAFETFRTCINSSEEPENCMVNLPDFPETEGN